MKLLLGIDGGGTKTCFYLTDNDGKCLDNITLGASNWQRKNDFFRTSRDYIEHISKFLKSFKKKELIKLDIIGGFAGVSEYQDSKVRVASFYKEIFLEIGINVDKIIILSDSELVLKTCCQKEPGIIVISGTGSVFLGQDKYFNIYRSGGFGYLIDDCGSGYYFGKKAIKIALSGYYDGFYTPLIDLIKKQLGISKIIDVLPYIYEKDSVSRVASFAPLIFKSAELECVYAEEIINNAIQYFVENICSCNMRISGSVSYNKDIPIYLHGSVFRGQTRILNSLQEKIGASNIYINNIPPQESAISILISGV